MQKALVQLAEMDKGQGRPSVVSRRAESTEQSINSPEKKMTLVEMQQETIAHWMTYFKKDAKRLGAEELAKQSLACARLTRMEMDSLKLIGLDEEAAWTEARNLFCLAPPPKLERP